MCAVRTASMKALFPRIEKVFLVAALLPLVSAADVYHVSSGGRAEAKGTADDPMSTIGEAAAKLAPGDTCVVHEGLYRECVVPVSSGTADAPIAFRAARGERVVITGCEALSGWNTSNGVVSAHVPWPVDQVFIESAAMTPARHPNRGTNMWSWDSIDFHQVGKTPVFTNSTLTQPPGFWKGARVWGLSRRLGWVSGSSIVEDSAPGMLRLASANAPWYGGGKGRGYITGSRAAMDAPGEWCQEDDTFYLLLPGGIGDAPAPRIEVTKRRWSFDLSGRSHVRVVGFKMVAGAVNMIDATNCVVDGCSIEWPSFDNNIRGGFNRDRGIHPKTPGLGVTMGGVSNAVLNSVVAHGTGDGVSLYGGWHTVSNCVIHDFNLSATDCAPITCTGVGHTITRSTLFNGGRSILVHRHLKRGRITFNHLYNAGLLSNDLGVTYTYQTNGEGTLIAYNHVHDNHGRKPGCVGIYLDDMTSRHIVHHNVVYGVTEAMAMNPPRSMAHLVYHNTLDGTIVSLGMYKSDKQDMTGTRFVNNILMTRLSSYMVNAEVGTNVFPGVDPEFTDREAGDYTLRAESPAVDAGDLLQGFNDGFVGAAPDMGAYERGQEPWRPGAEISRDHWCMRPEWALLPGHRGPCFVK